MTVTERRDLSWFNGLPSEQAEAELHACNAAHSWVREVNAARPYSSLEALFEASGKAIADLDAQGLGEALAAHPRIGERSGGQDRESAWSRGEQSGMDVAAAELRQALVEGNQAYEARFDQVFLICATGRSAEEMLSNLRGRLGNDPETERNVVRGELARISELRLAKLINGEG